MTHHLFLARKPSFLLFSEVLFADTSLYPFLVRSFASYAILKPYFKTLIYLFTHLLVNSPKHLRRPFNHFELNYAKQTQFTTCPNSCKPFFNNALRKFAAPRRWEKQTQYKANSSLSATPQTQNKPNPNPIFSHPPVSQRLHIETFRLKYQM